MALDGLHKARRAWEEEILRAAVLCSLLCQIILLLLADCRRRTGNKYFRAIIWSAYLLADWSAIFGIGLISSGSAKNESCEESREVNKQLAAFWAPFLLLHLGGPNTITALALEDNELWIRHLVEQMVQMLVILLVFLLSLPIDYWIPTVLVFLAGICKYSERTISMYRACLENFKKSLFPKPDPGHNYCHLMEEYATLETFRIPVTIEVVEESQVSSAPDMNTTLSTPVPLEEMEIMLKGYDLFESFKGLIVDHMFGFQVRHESRMFFFNRLAADAFRVMEVELSFIYDAFYTKLALVHCKKGYACRFACILLMAACFQQFISHLHSNMLGVDRIVTYILLCTALALEIIGLLHILVSDWAIVSAKNVVAKFLLGLRLRIRRRRWSNTVGQHSFISFCLEEERFAWLIAKKEEGCEEGLKELVFNELKAKAMKGGSSRRRLKDNLTRGEDVLSDYPSHLSQPSIWASLSDEVEYDESLLLWHIATDLCYFTTDSDSDSRDNHHIKNSKLLSDYMLHLLVMRPKLMSTVAGIAQIRFQDTREEARKCFKMWRPEIKAQTRLDDQRKRACELLLQVQTKVKPNQVKGDKSKSLLFDACILANDLKEMDDDRRWEMISRVWVEQLSYAAIRCRPSDHARRLSRGGEFITFVWLLMVHFGLGEQFEAGQARAKLLVGKSKI